MSDTVDIMAEEFKIAYPLTYDAIYNKGRADAIEEFAHSLKETFNNEFPSNYHCTQPYFTLDNVRVLTDLVAKEQKND